VDANRPNFLYQSGNDSTGPIVFGNYIQELPKGKTRTHRFKKVQPQFVVAAGSTSSLPNGIIDSSIGYRLFEQMTTLGSSDIRNNYAHTEAVNNAILNTLETGNLLLGVSAIEFKRTQAMVRRTFISIYNLLMDLYRGIKRGAVKDLYQAGSNAWLEVRYGYRPLALELKALYDLINKDYDKTAVLSKYGTQAYKDINDIYPFNTIITNAVDFQDTEFGFRFSGNLVIKNVYVKVGLNYLNTIDSRNLSLLAELGLDLESLPGTIYELVPYSFVLDMFTKTGSLLGADTFTSDVLPFNGYISYTMDYEINGSYSDIALPVVVQFPAFFDWDLYNQRVLSRSVLQSIWNRYGVLGVDGFLLNTAVTWVDFPKCTADPVTKQFVWHNVRVDQNNAYYSTSLPYGMIVEYPDWSGGFNSNDSTYSYPAKIMWPSNEGSVIAKYQYVPNQPRLPFLPIALDEFFIPYDPIEGGQELLDTLALEYGYYFRDTTLNSQPQRTLKQWLFAFHDEVPPNIGFADNSTSYDLPNSPGFYYWPLSFIVGSWNWGVEIEDRQKVATFYRPRITTKVNPLDEYNLTTDYNQTGRFTSRDAFDDFTYNQILSLDLSASQMADLAILSERLISSLSRGRK
jgi:hypothetical protein